MKRHTSIVLGLLAVALLLGVTSAALAAETKGKMKSVTPDKKEFVITDNDQQDHEFHLARGAKVYINDKEVKLADLRAGDAITVTYEKENEKLMCSLVRCKRD